MTTTTGQPSNDEDMAQRLADLQASEARYITLLNNIPAAILQVDASHMGLIFRDLKKLGVTDIEDHLAQNPDLVEFANASVEVKEVNDVAVAMFGATCASQLIGPVSFIFRETPGAAERVMAARFREKPNLTQTVRIKTFDGRLIDALFMVSYPQETLAFDRTILLLKDITEQVRIERELKRMDEQFTRFARLSLLAEFSGSIVHEVRQPLSVVLTDVATTLRWLAKEDPNLPKVRQLMGRIKDSVHRANDVIQRVKDLSRKSQPTKVYCHINELVSDALAFVTREGSRRSVRFSTDLDEVLPSVEMDAVQIQQLLVNLLVNAIQAVEQSDHEPRQVFVRTRLRDDYIVVEVEDTGLGIQEGAEAEIFDSFVTSKENGMGMGLSICRAIARGHGGEVSVRNVPSGGAIFEARLPVGHE